MPSTQKAAKNMNVNKLKFKKLRESDLNKKLKQSGLQKKLRESDLNKKLKESGLHKKQRESDLNNKNLPSLNVIDLLKKHVSPSKRPKLKDRWRLASSKSGKSGNADKTSANNASSNEVSAAQLHPVTRLMMRNACNGNVQSARLQK